MENMELNQDIETVEEVETEVNGVETDEEIEVEILDDDEADEEGTEETAEDTEEHAEAEETGKTVPLAALHEERTRHRALKKEYAQQKAIMDRLLENTGAKDLSEMQERMDSITLRKYVENQGMDEQTAKVFLMQQKKIKELENAQNAKEYDREIQTLKDNPFYADIDNVLDDVTEYAKDKNISLKEAYNALYAEQRALALQKEAEQRALKKSATKQGKKISALSSSGNVSAPKKTVRLTRAEAEFAEAAGMTPAEYARYKKKD